ncbi:hypothetical protein DFJ74DRAFT_712996 [Hyaloraphidium curvatum]|nr:hypothetical protein DFJ74DRAFT_712996 [Hyaloraphidium curvatum]
MPRLTFQFHAEMLISTDTNGDPYLTLSRPRNRNELNGPLFEIYKTAVKPETVNPVWEPFAVNLEDLCGGDTSLPLLWTVKDKDTTNTDDYVGFATLSLDQLLQSKLRNSPKHTLIDTKKVGQPGYSHSGFLVIDLISIA